eukprot:GHVS01079841.1.p1 GENE.GHVS01079841.1~~GHVS01079841.1.p1  ORF type:complete len:308 (-),score=41.18 GHVS01079841.1:398-1321(-)
MVAAEVMSSSLVFDGTIYRCQHISKTLGGLTAKFSVFIPDLSPLPPSSSSSSIPSIYCLSGLTCTDENFVVKAGAFRAAAKHRVALVIPDTSPRGANIAGEDADFSIGTGAGFYVNATVLPWSRHYQMYDYVLKELPSVVGDKFQCLHSGRRSLLGHSMGGHGALVLGLRNPGTFCCVSAFAPICRPSESVWGKKAFETYLGKGDDGWRQRWAQYDAVDLVGVYEGPLLPLLVDQGGADEFLGKGGGGSDQDQLRPHDLVEAVKQRGGSSSKIPLEYNTREGYDHSYFFISTFIDSHIEFHARYLQI